MKQLVYLGICAVLTFFSTNVQSQSPSTIDSLTNLLSKFEEPDNIQVRVMSQLASELNKDDATSARPIALDALDMAKTIKDAKGQSDCYFSLQNKMVFLNG